MHTNVLYNSTVSKTTAFHQYIYITDTNKQIHAKCEHTNIALIMLLYKSEDNEVLNRATKKPNTYMDQSNQKSTSCPIIGLSADTQSYCQ